MLATPPHWPMFPRFLHGYAAPDSLIMKACSGREQSMGAARSTVTCVHCGAANRAGTPLCAVCGQPLAGAEGSLGDPMANSIGGAPVPSAAHDPHIIHGGLQQAGERLEPLLRDAAGILSDRLAERRSLPPAARRLQARLDLLSKRAPPYVPPPPPGPPLALRAAWYVVAGVVCTLLWIIAAWMGLVSVAGRAAAAKMLHRAPSILTLHIAGPQPPAWMTSPVPYRPSYPAPSPPTSLPRVLYFLFIGWWASLIWLIFGYLAVLSVVGVPLAYRMFDAAPKVAYLGQG
jgi:hypothetical protein